MLYRHALSTIWTPVSVTADLLWNPPKQKSIFSFCPPSQHLLKCRIDMHASAQDQCKDQLIEESRAHQHPASSTRKRLLATEVSEYWQMART